MTIHDEILGKDVGAWTGYDYRLARKLLALTQAELGAKIGFTRQWIVTIEAGTTKPPPMMGLAMKYLLVELMAARDDG